MPDWIIVILRSFTLLILLYFFTRWLGKKQLSRLSIFEYITGIVLGGIVAIHSFDMSLNIFDGIMAMFVWFMIPYAVEKLSLKNKKFRNYFQGQSTVFIQNGKVLEDNLKKEGYSADDFLEELRSKDVFNVSEIDYAILEPSGNLSIFPKKEYQPLTAKTLGLKVSPEKPPQTVIMDGKIMLEPLANRLLNPDWLETELAKKNISIENVFIGQVNEDGQLMVDLYDEQMHIVEPMDKQLLLATMKKSQADLDIFALQANDDNTKQMYQKNSQKLQQVIDLVTPHLSNEPR